MPTSILTYPLPTAIIKPNVGAWQYQGCFKYVFQYSVEKFVQFSLYYRGSDMGDRPLLHQLTMSSNSAEICTSACGANGYQLARLEYGL
jgi:hypothetical protein